MEDEVTLGIGDIHGMFDQLIALLSACRGFLSNHAIKLIFLGDYIDRGPSSKLVVDFLIALQRDDPEGIICLRGNHEQMLLDASRADRSDRQLTTWFGNGGEATLESYGIGDPMEVPAEHLNWMRALPLFYQDEQRFFVHAGIRPGVPLEAQKPEDLLWIREPFLDSAVPHPKVIIHGHSPTRNRLPELTSSRVNLDVGACFGGQLTAAVFLKDERAPRYFVNCNNQSWQPES